MAVDEVNITLQNKKENIKKATQLKFKLSQVSYKLSKTQKDDLLEDTKSCNLQLQDLETHLSNSPESKAIKDMNKRRYYKIVKKYRLGRRKCGSGRPKMLDGVDEKFVLECIENKLAAQRRRHDAAMYTGRRVKKCDFLKIANFIRTRRGLKTIRSIYNRD